MTRCGPWGAGRGGAGLNDSTPCIRMNTTLGSGMGGGGATPLRRSKLRGCDNNGMLYVLDGWNRLDGWNNLDSWNRLDRRRV